MLPQFSHPQFPLPLLLLALLLLLLLLLLENLLLSAVIARGRAVAVIIVVAMVVVIVVIVVIFSVKGLSIPAGTALAMIRYGRSDGERKRGSRMRRTGSRHAVRHSLSGVMRMRPRGRRHPTAHRRTHSGRERAGWKAMRSRWKNAGRPAEARRTAEIGRPAQAGRPAEAGRWHESWRKRTETGRS